MSSSPPQAKETTPPKAKAKSRMTKKDYEDQNEQLQTQLRQLQHDLDLERTKERSFFEREQGLLAAEADLFDKEQLVQWTFEQQEAVLLEANDKGIDLAQFVLQQRLLIMKTLGEDSTEEIGASRARQNRSEE